MISPKRLRRQVKRDAGPLPLDRRIRRNPENALNANKIVGS